MLIRIVIILACLSLPACTGVFLVAAIPGDIVEYSLVDEINMNDGELKQSLSINIQAHSVSHNLIVKNDGSLWSINEGMTAGWKRNAYIGRSSPSLFGRIEFIDDVKMAVTTVNSHLVVKKDGTVWSWGGGDIALGGFIYESTLGYSSSKSTDVPRLIIGLPPISYIAYVDGVVMATAHDGSVWSWGFKYLNLVSRKELKTHGDGAARVKGLNQVGINYWSNFTKQRSETSVLPVKIPELGGVVKAYGGAYLTKNGDVLVVRDQTLGDESFDFISKYIAKVRLPNKAVDISNGYALLENGHVWYLGQKSGGQKNNIVPSAGGGYSQEEPFRLESLSDVVKLSDSIALINDGRLVIWGHLYSNWGGYLTVKKTVYSPVLIKSEAQKIISFSRNSLVDESGGIWFRSRNALFNESMGLSLIEGDVYLNPISRYEFISQSMNFHKLINVSLN